MNEINIDFLSFLGDPVSDRPDSVGRRYYDPSRCQYYNNWKLIFSALFSFFFLVLLSMIKL